MSQPYRRLPTYGAQLTGSFRTPKGSKTTPWRWPSLWAFSGAFGLQLLFGMPATMVTFIFLLAFDENWCPAAVGAVPMRPFLCWLFGACLGIYTCEQLTPEKRNATNSWVFVGVFSELLQYLATGEFEE